MTRSGLSGVAVAAALGVALITPGPRAESQVPDPVTPLIQQLCDYEWVDAVCDGVAFDDPQYVTNEDPSAGQPLLQLAGAIHEHSSYSDGYPGSRPADYFGAARTGHNQARDGTDTGIRIDFMYSSEHSDNERLAITTSADCIDPSGIPDGLAELDLVGIFPPLACSALDRPDHWVKWAETQAQAIEATEYSAENGYTGFTGMRGFEWTNDYYNHLGVYFSRNTVNVKIDGSYLSMDVMWDWLRAPVDEGGGADALIVFNHPGGLPALTPFDGDFPHNELLQTLRGGANWNDVAYVPDVDERVAGIEVNGGDDLSWYVRALTNGWHLGPVAAEDEHGQQWSSSADGKTLVFARGRSPRDHYFAMQQHRTVAIDASLVGGAPGEAAVVPSILYWADAADIQDPAATLLGGTSRTGGDHVLHFQASGLPAGSPVVLMGGALAAPQALGVAGPDGAFGAAVDAGTPATGEHWWFVVVCPPDTADCGVGEDYSAVTAPIWLAAASTASTGGELATGSPAGGDADAGASRGGALPATGTDAIWWPWLLAAGALLVRRRSREAARR